MKEKLFLLLAFLVVNPYSVIAQGQDDKEYGDSDDRPVCGTYWPPEPPDIQIYNANYGDFPWHVGMLVFKDPWAHSVGRWLCAGTIISNLWILTNALCLENTTKAEIYPGSIHLFKDSIYEVHYAYEFHIHVNYTVLERNNNIGLVKLYRPLTLDTPDEKLIKSIKLSNYEMEVYTAIKTPGWGAYQNDYYRYSNKSLMYSASYVIDKKLCQQFYTVNLLEEEFCAVLEDSYEPNSELTRDCFTTYGAAAIDCYNETAVGVFAFVGAGESHCGQNFPLGFVKIYAYRDWIFGITGI